MKKKFSKINSKRNAGFTIIEMMIAISVFLVVIMFGMGSLLNANLIHRKSQDVRSIMDNLSFIMEDMSRNLRTGYNYHCIDDDNFTAIDTPRSCSDGGGFGIAFETSLGERWVYYISEDGVFRSTEAPYEPDETYVELTSDRIIIDSGTFTVVGAEAGDDQQPLIIIGLAGRIESPKGDTPFSLQTSVSQRLLDIGASPVPPPVIPSLPALPSLPEEKKIP
ncbi:prepilin-type N-terminal cleavage/methylation domain-containing protein [Patescibacteria group bacterium]|nr:prepilin-type N-terminal cleavage/methylation domain-containing protein [Patescibacteria group bacterium]MBU1727760.1 prepilin-type N-terminal cleavage/methylation domain-containing protein [Patescibacteria group bacterium]